MEYKKEDVRNAVYELIAEEKLKPVNVVIKRPIYGVKRQFVSYNGQTFIVNITKYNNNHLSPLVELRDLIKYIVSMLIKINYPAEKDYKRQELEIKLSQKFGV